MKKYYFLIITLTLILCIYLLTNYNSSKEENNSYIVNDNSNIKNVEESTSELDYLYNNRNYSFDDITNSITENIDGLNDNISIYYYNFDTKESYSVNENNYFVAASLRKIPQIMQVLDKVNNGEFTLDTKIDYLDSDYIDGTGIIQFETSTDSYSIEELIRLSIVESDNIAHNMLNRICNYTLEEYISSITTDYKFSDDGYVRFTSKQMYEILYRLYTNPDNNPYYPQVIETMKETSFHDRLDKYIPYDKVAHKIGNYYRYYHDAGFIFAKETYILVVLTKDIGELSNSPEFEADEEERFLIDWGDTACELTAKISNDIFNIVNQ